jgi:hypothetical protein
MTLALLCSGANWGGLERGHVHCHQVPMPKIIVQFAVMYCTLNSLHDDLFLPVTPGTIFTNCSRMKFANCTDVQESVQQCKGAGGGRRDSRPERRET